MPSNIVAFGSKTSTATYSSRYQWILRMYAHDGANNVYDSFSQGGYLMSSEDNFGSMAAFTIADRGPQKLPSRGIVA
jgi:hypothetical protein